ncbi:hypothetical protein B0J17DRAFT_220138 [Rhizoctonia solani]|nr:hypothetical protein B0J17DRAFT_220138 [Rhizoctonia solani]
MAFPNIKSLLLQDLYFNTLQRLLPTIASGSYRLMPFLSPKSLETNVLRNGTTESEGADDMEPEPVNVNKLGRVLSPTPVDTLMISGVKDACWLTGPELRNLLTSMPTVKTLKMSHWDVDHLVWKALRRSPAARSRPDDPVFPAFESLHFYSTMSFNQRGFKNMVTSHPIQSMVLGAVLAKTADELSKRDSCNEDDGITKWLKFNISTFRLVSTSSTYEPPEFCSEILPIFTRS